MVYKMIIIIIAAFITGGLLIGKTDISSVLPLAAVLICPIMMIFMMKNNGCHDHKKDDGNHQDKKTCKEGGEKNEI